MHTQLLTLPNELLQFVAEYLDPKDINALIQTCRRLAHLLTPLLHKLALEDKDGTSALHWASMRGYIPLVRLVLDNGGKVNGRDGLGKTPLHKAAESGYGDIAWLLLERGANIFAVDYQDDMPIHDAAEFHQEDVVKIFLELGVGANAPGRKGSTPLHRTLRYGSRPGPEMAMVKLLLGYGARPTALDEKWRMALVNAAHRPDILSLLYRSIPGYDKLVDQLGHSL